MTIKTKNAGAYASIVGIQVKKNGIYAAVQGAFVKVAGTYQNVLGSVTTTGGILSLIVADTTPIDPVSSIGANGSGWVGIVKLKGLTGITGAIDATALTLTVSDPGYDTAGNVTTVLRTITGVAPLRRQYPNGNSKMISTDGTDLTIYISLDDWVYAGSTIITAAIGPTFYTGCAASSAPTKTNLSATAYIKPLFSWINPQNDKCGSTYAVEAVAFHRSARNGQQVAAIKYSVTDGTNTSADVLVSTTSLSSRITQGNIPEVWAGTVNASTMTQAAICTVNAKVYPWIGDSSAVLNLTNDGATWPTALPITKLRVLCDRTGGYGGAYAYVSSNAPSGSPVVSATAATAKANPYGTIAAAMTAVVAWNSANKGHNDLGGASIRLMDNGSGGAQTHTISAAGINLPGACWCEVMRDPASTAVISVTWGSQSQMPAMCRWSNVRFVIAISFNLLGYNGARDLLCLDTCTIDNTVVGSFCAWYDLEYLYNLNLVGGRAIVFNSLPLATFGIAIMAGVTGTGASSNCGHQPSVIVGCNLNNYHVADMPTTSDGKHGRIIYNNKLYMAIVGATTVNTMNFGLANVQNLYEHDGLDAAVMSMNYFADGDNTTFGNYIEQHNTAVGNRASRMYSDNPSGKIAPNGLQKIASSRYNIWDNTNIKSDTFQLAGGGSVGNWAYMYGTGNAGNVSLFGEVSRSAGTLPHNDNSDTPYMGSAWLATSEPNLFRTSLGFTQAQIMAMFGSYTVGPQAVPAIGGNYKPVSSATYLKGRVPSGMSILKYDVAGTLRRTDGTGAAGAYESL